ncbi:MAG: hypothetical protein P4L40_22075 [Terracidiphilus sp.]|nr:hypothetical protein [Terracidiphilus sp.]
MQIYRNMGGDSGVTGFEISDGSIVVEFKDRSAYLYDYSRPGQAAVEYMKQLAIAGRGLNSYISSHVKKNYARKLR